MTLLTWLIFLLRPLTELNQVIRDHTLRIVFYMFQVKMALPQLYHEP